MNRQKFNIAERIRTSLWSALFAVLLLTVLSNTEVNASSISGNNIDRSENATSEIIDNSDREAADAELKHHMDSILFRYDPDEYTLQKLNDTFYSAVYYIANTEMSELELWSYVGEMKGKLEAVLSDSSVTKTTTEFLQLGNNWQTPTVRYGENVSIVLPIINLGSEELTDLVVSPVISTDVAEWPFEPNATGYVQSFAEIPGNPFGGNYDAAMFARRELTFTFKVREDVPTGYYPLKFEVWYTKAGVRCEKPVELTAYVYTQGKPGAGSIGGNSNEVESKPRIIVTGFETEPANVYAGDTFVVTIHVKNTSRDTAVTNVLFDMQAVEGGSEANTTYAVFLPTSGSSSVYTDAIAPGSEYDINIEMTAKTDLSQKPYVLTVNMKYDAGKNIDLSDEAKVSIPVLQEAKFDTSTVEVMPESISLGNQSNVMFSIYNTGKTTFYNLQVKYEDESVSGGEAFLGTLKPGETANVDSMLTGAAPSEDGMVTAVITFEDESGNEVRFEEEFSLNVYEEVYEEPVFMEEMPMEEEANGPKIGLIIAIIAAVILAAAGIVVLVTVKKRKKRISAKKKEEAFLGMDE